MHDELDELRSVNPTPLAHAERVVALDRTALLDALEHDAADDVGVAPTANRRRPRIGYLGAVAAAAAVFVPFAVLALVDRGGQPIVVDDGLVPGSAVVATDPTVPPTVAPIEPEESAAVVIDAPPLPTTTAPPTGSAVTETVPPSVPVEDATIVPTEPVATSIPSPAATTVPPTESPTSSVPTTAPTSAPTAQPDGGDDIDEEPAPAWPSIDGPFDRERDLLVLHFDFAHLDDGHAAVAGRDVADHFGLDPLVVAGTQSSDSTAFVHEYGSMMAAAWDDDWVDAGADRLVAVEQAAANWLTTLDAGGSIWVAEGGVSDFTAEVVREVERWRPSLDASSVVHVVQHAERNEGATQPDDLDLVLVRTDYVRIDDGNDPNGTADLNGPSVEFEAAALAAESSTRWAAAFDYLPAGELDFSDTVAVLHIVGVGVDEVADAGGFATAFLSTV